MLNFSRYFSFKSKNILKSQKGMALLSVLIFTFILVAVVVSMLTMAQNDTKRSTLQRDSTKAFYLAESGIEQTLWRINNPDDPIGNGITISNDPDDPDHAVIISESNWTSGNSAEYYEVTISPVLADDTARGEEDEMKDWVYIDSTGVVKGNGVKVSGKRSVKVKVHYTFNQNTSTTYDKAILTDQLITFQGNPGAHITGGDIHSNREIDVRGPFDFEGTATTSGVPDDWPDTPYSGLNDLDDTDDGDFSGPGSWPIIPIPEVPYGDGVIDDDDIDGIDLMKMAIDNGTYFPNDLDTRVIGRGPHSYTGIVYVEGDVIFRNGDSLTITDGALVVVKEDPDDPDDATGTVEFKNGSNLTIERTEPLPEGAYPGPIAVAAQGDIQLHASSSSLNGVVQSGGYYNDEGEPQPGGLIEFHNSSVVTGAVVAEEVWMHNETTINYDGDFLNAFTTSTVGDGLYKKTSWQEVY